MAAMKRKSEILQPLDAIQVHYKDAFIAGGCLRDLLNNKEISDIDIFTFMQPKPEHEWASILGHDQCETYEDARVLDVLDASKLLVRYEVEDPVYPTQLISLTNVAGKTPQEAIEGFMFGLQQIRYDDKQEVIVATPAYYKDIEEKTITLMRCNGPNDVVAADSIWCKLHYKYPDYQLVIPPKFQSQWNFLTR